MNKQIFRKDFLVVTFDKELKKASTFRLYHIMRGFADMRTHEVIISIRKIAERMDCDRRTVQRNLAILINMGLITRTLRKSPYDPRMNLASHFVVHDIDAERYADLENENIDTRQICRPTTTTIVPPPSGKATAQHFLERFEEDFIKENNKGTTENISLSNEKNYVEKSDSESKANISFSETDITETFNLDSESNTVKKSDTVIKADVIEKQKSESESNTTMTSNPEAEADLESKEKSTNKTENSSADASDNDSTIRSETVNYIANYLIARTGRKKLIEPEYKVLEELSNDKELPKITELIIKLIDETINRFTRKNKNLNNVTFCYIAKVLESRRYEKKTKDDSKEKNSQTPKKRSDKKTTKQNNSEPKIKPELTMPVEEAEKAITDYAQGKEQTNALPTALLEIFEKIKSEQNKRDEEFYNQQNAELDRAEKTGEPAQEIEFEYLTLEDYLHMKFPEAEEEELHRDMKGEIHETYDDFPQRWLLEEAFEIDFTCAMCEDPRDCSIPKDYQQSLKKKRPHAEMFFNKNGKKFLGVRCEGCVKCKYGALGKTEREMELKSRIKDSGLTAMQVNQTFDAFDHQNATPEVVVAKAQAILAAKNKTNLILAGKPGTGKTHLASAIALEAIKNGNQAIFKSLPELLDQICCAYQNNADPYGLMLKYKSVQCLILDDWGKEKTTDARMDYLFQIIDYRYRNRLQTIVTTNAFNAEDLKNHWNADKIEPLVSRILENGQWVTIYDSENHRLKNSPKPEVLEQKTQEELTLPEVTTIPESQDSQEIYEAETEVLEKIPSDVVLVNVDEADNAENFSEPENSFESVESVPLEPETEFETLENDSEKSFSEPRKISQIFPRAQAEKKEVKPSRELWQEIAESAEYKAMSESDKIKKQWEFFRECPEYESLTLSDKVALQLDFCQRIEEAKQREALFAQFTQQANESGNVINVPQYDDGLEDDDDELKL